MLIFKIQSNNLSIFWEIFFDYDNRERGKGARRGFSVTLAATTHWIWPLEVSCLFADSILKFWLPGTKVEDESLQVVLLMQNCKTCSLLQSRTWAMESLSAMSIQIFILNNKVWDVQSCMAIVDLRFKMTADKHFLIALHHGHMTRSHVSPIKQNQFGGK